MADRHISGAIPMGNKTYIRCDTNGKTKYISVYSNGRTTYIRVDTDVYRRGMTI